ncbi:acyltransferase [Prevotella sp. E15-22]|uniref:acyltransferase n=1 Tax=Prevotella sp. E15-22 TaxID=2937774 RepID=UPI0020535F46|nr:acyltransferase [Prevotella sp. E15-22]UPS45263.1 acyltransferase [Prevotella sp. E15-22]
MKLIYYIRKILALRSSDAYSKWLRSNGIVIMGGVHFNPRSTLIDITRPSLVTIGENCYFNSNFTLLTHDYVAKVFIESGRDYLPSSGRVTIGNNVSTGRNVTILKGVTIGDNVFIAAGSIVTKDIPSNSIAAGVPCKVIMSLEDYYQKRKREYEKEAQDYANSIRERYKREPRPEDFWEEFPLFVSGNEVDNYPQIPIKYQLGPSFVRYIKEHKAKYKSFKDFVDSSKMIK